MKSFMAWCHNSSFLHWVGINGPIIKIECKFDGENETYYYRDSRKTLTKMEIYEREFTRLDTQQEMATKVI